MSQQRQWNSKLWLMGRPYSNLLCLGIATTLPPTSSHLPVPEPRFQATEIAAPRLDQPTGALVVSARFPQRVVWWHVMPWLHSVSAWEEQLEAEESWSNRSKQQLTQNTVPRFGGPAARRVCRSSGCENKWWPVALNENPTMRRRQARKGAPTTFPSFVSMVCSFSVYLVASYDRCACTLFHSPPPQHCILNPLQAFSQDA